MRANAAEWVRLGIAAGAHLSLARGDTTSALRQLEALPDSSCAMFCAEVPLLTAQLLAGRGRYHEADSLLARRWVVLAERPIELLFALERGRVSEQLEKREAAIEAYTLVIDAWANGDSLVQPAVQAAREGLRRLGVDESARRPVRR
jgi:hypothetical protein